MFYPEREVPSLELCKRLKELGFLQESGGWYWRKDMYGNFELEYKPWASPIEKCLKHEKLGGEEIFIKAPTVRELGEWLPAKIKDDSMFELVSIKMKDEMKDEWLVAYTDEMTWFEGEHMVEDTEANARAKMLVWLAENGYVKFEKEWINE